MNFFVCACARACARARVCVCVRVIKGVDRPSTNPTSTWCGCYVLIVHLVLSWFDQLQFSRDQYVFERSIPNNGYMGMLCPKGVPF